jgi:adenylate kinase
MTDRYHAMLLFGAPGVGKGTQGKVLGQIPGMRHLATGNIFRELDQQSDLGRRVSQHMKRGELVPDDLTIQIWRQYVQRLIDERKFTPQRDLLILDGIPRSLNQAKAIEPHIHVLRIIHLTCTDIDGMVMRMKRRALQENRPDDADEAVIRRRFEVYEAQTQPVLSYYDPRLIARVNAVGAPVEVLLHILEALVPVYRQCLGNPLE